MSVRYDETTGSWIAQHSARHPLSRKTKTLRRIGIKTEAEAKRVFAELQIIIKQSFEETGGGKMTVYSLRQRFYESLQHRDLAGGTVSNYKLCLDAHTSFWDMRTIESIRTDEIRNLIKVKLADKSPSHQKTILKFVRGLFNFAVESGFLLRNPVPKMQFRLGDKIKKVLTREQMKMLLEKARDMNHEWYEIWAFALYSGCRSGELHALTKDKVDLENRSILISCAWDSKSGIKDYVKNKQDRVIEIPQPLVPIIKSLIAKYPDSNFLLPRIEDWDKGRQAEVLRTFLMGIGLPPVTFHNLRASWATAMLGMGVEPAKVMLAGGWSTLTTMMIYMRKAGITIRGMTDNFRLHDPSPSPAQVIPLFSQTEAL